MPSLPNEFSKEEIVERCRAHLMGREDVPEADPLYMGDDCDGYELVIEICPECNRQTQTMLNLVVPRCPCGWDEGKIIYFLPPM